ncbi:MAG: hypothetical protein ACR2PH_12025, partial [Desulfobulbia bacterium]
MTICYIDYETYSEVDLPQAGAHNYCADHTFKPLLLAYAFGDDPVKVFQFSEGFPFELPEAVVVHAAGDGVFCAHGQFDRFCLNRSLIQCGFRLPISRYIDTSVLASEVGLPPSLLGASTAMKLDVRKNPMGKKCIKTFAIPDPVEGRRFPDYDIEMWDIFVDYAKDDVEICRQLHQKLPGLPPVEKKLYELDTRINDRGIRVDLPAVKRFNKLAKAAVKDLNRQVAEVTDGEIQTTGQVAKIAEYLGITSCAEKALDAALESGELNDKQTAVARIRLDGARTSTKKLPKMISGAYFIDQRCRGQLQFCGTHTKRWAGRGFQPHNLPRESFKPDVVDDVVETVRKTGSLPDQLDALKTISMCLRGMVIPAPGHILAPADYSQIEARLVAWYAGQTDALAIYDSGGDIYKEMAST